MEASGTTSLDVLPGGVSSSNDPVQLVAQDVANELKASAPVYSATNVAPTTARLDDQNAIVKSLASASKRGFTAFPQQDVVHSSIPHQTDPARQQDYIPRPAPRMDYIAADEATRCVPHVEHTMEDESELWFEAVKLPVLVASCYFLYQTPPARRLIRAAFPLMISQSGGFNMQGQMLSSVIFGAIVYGGTQLLDVLSA